MQGNVVYLVLFEYVDWVLLIQGVALWTLCSWLKYFNHEDIVIEFLEYVENSIRFIILDLGVSDKVTLHKPQSTVSFEPLTHPTLNQPSFNKDTFLHLSDFRVFKLFPAQKNLPSSRLSQNLVYFLDRLFWLYKNLSFIHIYIFGRI